MNKSLRHPFRIFFPLTGFSVLIALLPWLTLAYVPRYAVFPLHWHAFTFIALTGSAAFAGFLLTALPAWCGDKRNLTPHSLVLVVLWCAALSALPAAPPAAAWLITAFWFYLLALTLHIIVKSGNSRQISLLLLLILLCIASAAYARSPDARWLHFSVDIMLVGVAVINFRVGRALGNQALEDGSHSDTRFIPNPYYKNLSCLWLATAAIAALTASPAVQGWLYLAAAMSFAARLNDWHDRRLLRRAYVRAHYSASLGLTLGYSALAVALLLSPAHISHARHFLAIAVYLLMILTIMGIAGQRHSGLKLHFAPDIRLALTLLLAAGLSRALLATFYPDINTLYRFPASAIAAAFLYYILRYLRIFARTDPHRE